MKIDLSRALLRNATPLTAFGQYPAEIPHNLSMNPRADSTPAELIKGLNTSVEALRSKLDESVKGKVDDVVFKEELGKINASVGNFQSALDQVTAAIEAAKLGGGDGERRIRNPEHFAAFDAFVRQGDEKAITAVQAAMTKGTNSEGGYLAPVEWDRTLEDRLVEVSPMRQIATVQRITGTGFSKLFNNRGTGSGWVGETASRPETTAPTIGTMTYNTGEIYANPSASQTILDDAEVDIEAFIAGEIETEFSYQEGIAFVSGNGTNKPYGFLTFATGAANAAVHPWGDIKATTIAGVAAVTPDELVTHVYALPDIYQQNARWVMNRNTIATLRKLKDSDGNYLWQPGLQAGQPQNLLARPITEMAAMPNMAANALAIAFGDFRRGYMIIDRMGVRMLRDPYTNKPYVMFYTTKRVGGGLLNPDAIKILKNAAS